MLRHNSPRPSMNQGLCVVGGRGGGRTWAEIRTRGGVGSRGRDVGVGGGEDGMEREKRR